MKKIKLFDDDKNEVEVDLKNFYQHLLEFHSKGTSLHEEQGHYFTVNDEFRKKVKKLLDS
ncbi:MAG: hypothetical protein VW228_00920 [Pelagibacteraceae bacterium]